MSDWITTAHYAGERRLSISQARMHLEWLVAQGKADRLQSRKAGSRWKIGNGASGKRGKGEIVLPAEPAKPRPPDYLMQTLGVLVNGGTMSLTDIQDKTCFSHQTIRNYMAKLVELGLAVQVPGHGTARHRPTIWRAV